MARKAAANIDPQAKPPEPAPEINEPVEVTIEPEATETTEVAATPSPDEAVPKVVETQRAPEPAPASVATTPEDSERKITALSQRLQEMESADRLNKQNQEELNRKLAEANRQRQESARREFDAQMDSINNSIGAAQSIIDSAETEYEAATTSGDNKAAVAVVGKLSRAHAQLERLEYQKSLMEQRLEQSKRQPQAQPQPQRPQQQAQPQPQRPMTVEESIASTPLPERAKNWLRQHPEYLTDQKKNRLIQGAHDIATDRSGGEFTDSYFEHLENLLGIQKPAKNGSAGPPVSAPPTRETPSMATGTAPRPTVVRLEKEEREIAAQIAQSRNISQAEAERIYAQEKLKIKKENR